MSLETAALEHACNMVRRQVQEELKDLNLFFIVHAPGDRPKALEMRKAELLEQPGGQNVFGVLNLCAQFKPDGSMFVGFAQATENRFLSFMPRTKTIAGFYMNSADFTEDEDMQQGIYNLVWQALSLIDRYKNDEKEFYVINEGAVRPAYNLINLARENMLGDAFSAIMMELQGHKNFIHDLAKKRCEMTLQAIEGYRAEQFPYPIAADATQIVFDELMDGVSTKAKIINQAIDITREIGFTYDDNSIRQWTAFSSASQEMAWLEASKNNILGTAIYTSEDPYVRSTAYIVSETLNMEPAPLSDIGRYNPFTDQEVNERLHNRLCDETFKSALTKMARAEDAQRLIDKAVLQNEKLTQGNIIGWCGHALLSAQQAYVMAFDNNEHPSESARRAYKEARKSVSWTTMVKLSRLIMNKRRQGLEVTYSMLIDICQDHADFNFIAKTVNWANASKETSNNATVMTPPLAPVTPSASTPDQEKSAPQSNSPPEQNTQEVNKLPELPKETNLSLREDDPNEL